MALCMDGVEKLLQVIRDKIPEREEQDEVLWAILTAFRGPDIRESGFSSIKRDTTQRIRDWVYGLTEREAGDPDYWWDPPRVRSVPCEQVCGLHYVAHLRAAERAIQRLDPHFRIFRRL